MEGRQEDVEVEADEEEEQEEHEEDFDDEDGEDIDDAEAQGYEPMEQEEDEPGPPQAWNQARVQEETETLEVEGNLALASALQRRLLLRAFRELGLVGAAGLTPWCHCLGSVGVASVKAKELFQILDVDRLGEVAPKAFCDAALASEALVDSLRTSLDLVELLQLRHRLLLRGFKMAPHELLGSAELAAVCEHLGLVTRETDRRALLKGCASLCPPLQLMGRGDHMGPGLSVELLSWQLAIISTSAARLQSSALTGCRAIPESRVKDSQAPLRYKGKTPIEIVVQFKDPSTFPWRSLPETTFGRRFEELWSLAAQTGHRAAEQAVGLLTDPTFDRKT
mmetsp:Transcript_104489/g.185883  ORF Transcript_104489/g.185883 Transcript_104489/m.185883 type:complete len:337 (+) Transcript_104489:52-1062(+)